MIITDSILSALPAVLVSGALFTAIEVILPKLPEKNYFNGQTASSRISNLDGLRATLALGVVFSHIISYRECYFRGKQWNWPENFYFRHSGEASVLLFFMITGFLFWRKSIVCNGRIFPIKLYANRIRRIFPLYIFFWFITLVLILLKSNLQLCVPFEQLLKEISGFLLPGWRSWGPINSVERGYFATQTWSLKYELFFYLALPALALFARNGRTSTLLIGFAFLWVLLSRWSLVPPPSAVIAPFLIGMFTAHLCHVFPRIGILRGRLVAALLCGCAIAVPLLDLGAASRIGLAVYSAIFIAIAMGNSFFGLLTLRSTAWLGEESYSIYLLHPPILLSFLTGINAISQIGTMPVFMFWCVAGGGVLLTVGISRVTYRFIEVPFMR